MFKSFWKNLQLPKVEAQPEMRRVGTPAIEQPLDDVQAARKRFEQQKMTRRQALRKMGVMSATAVIGVLTIDDLARISAAKMQEHKATKAIGDSLAKEFGAAGVAFADASSPTSSDQCNPDGGPPVDCLDAAERAHCYCVQDAKDSNPECASIGDFLPLAPCAGLNYAVFLCGQQRTTDSRACEEGE